MQSAVKWSLFVGYLMTNIPFSAVMLLGECQEGKLLHYTNPEMFQFGRHLE